MMVNELLGSHCRHHGQRLYWSAVIPGERLVKSEVPIQKRMHSMF
jgi:hypothetical protein